MTGQTLGHYRIESKLGEGGMGVVWKARDPRLNRFIALKVLPPGLAQNEERRARFIQEAQAASALNHPNIITIYDIGRDDGADYIAMEYVDGATLGNLIHPRGMKVADVLTYAVQIADALAAAHQAGIVHRDLKPSNIMVTPSGLVKVLDFGLAKLTSAEPPSQQEATLTARAITEQGAVIGTAAYMSPEQAEGKPVDRRSDIFSFGAILYEMVAGQRPFSADTRLALLTAIVNSEPKPMAPPGPPLELDRIIRRCLRKDPSQRFQHMDDLKITLSDLKHESDSGTLLSAIGPAAVRSPRRTGVWLALAAVLIAAGGGGAAWIFNRSRLAPADRLTAVRQLTYDSGLTTDPAYWPAGNMVAYASDRATGTNLDIWVQQIGGETRQLTSNEADDHEPDFSPDGTRIAFRSERDGGGIFVVSTLGGTERRLTSTGYSPRFSPDGRWISYWVGDVSRNYNLGQTFIIPASGGEPRELAPKLRGAMFAVWSPDSKHLLFLGNQNRKFEFYVQSLDGGEPIATGLAEIAQAQGLGNYPTEWTGNRFLFSAPTGDAINLYSVEIDPTTFHARGPRERLTAGTGIESRPLLAGNRLIYASAVQNDDVWSVPIDLHTAKSTGDAVRITQDLGSDVGCSISDDGTRLAWFSVRSEEAHLMAKDLTSGQQTDLITVRRIRPLAGDISADGQRIAYTSRTTTPPSEQGFIIPFSGGTPEKVCDPCTIRDWAGPTALLFTKDGQSAMHLLDLTSRAARQIFDAAAPARGFPDGRWWAGYMPQGTARPAGTPSIYVVPILPDRSAIQSDSIGITPGEAGDYLVDVAPDGTTLFFLSRRDGFHCIWAQRIDPATHHAAGAPFAVHHFHSARRSTVYVSGGMRRLTAARNKIVFTMAERTGNIWIAELPGNSR